MKTMARKYIKYILISCFLICFGVIASTQDCSAGDYGNLEFDGTIRLTGKGRKLTLYVESMIYRLNSDVDYSYSGTPMIKLVASSEEYDGGDVLSGYTLLSKKFDSLYSDSDSEEYYNNIRISGTAPKIPKGTYYLTVLAKQYDGSDFYIDDYVSLNGTYKSLRSGSARSSRKIAQQVVDLEEGEDKEIKIKLKKPGHHNDSSDEEEAGGEVKMYRKNVRNARGQN